MHKIKPNPLILSNIKRKYELIRKQNKSIYNNEMIDKNIDKINEISKSKDLSDSKDNVYFDKKFEGKELFNAFIFFSQKLYDNKRNETHYSNYIPVNDIIGYINVDNSKNLLDINLRIDNSYFTNNFELIIN